MHQRCPMRWRNNGEEHFFYKRDALLCNILHAVCSTARQRAARRSNRLTQMKEEIIKRGLTKETMEITSEIQPTAHQGASQLSVALLYKSLRYSADVLSHLVDAVIHSQSTPLGKPGYSSTFHGQGGDARKAPRRRRRLNLSCRLSQIAAALLPLSISHVAPGIYCQPSQHWPHLPTSLLH